MNTLYVSSFLHNNSIQIDRNMRVAVVGSSDALLKNNHGSLIDSHNIIIRCNRAVIIEEKTGSRTDIRLVNPHMIEDTYNDDHASQHKEIFENYDRNFIFNIKNEHIIVKHGDSTIIENNPELIEKVKKNNNRIDMTSPELIENIHRKISSIPTCGFIAIILAISHYGEVNVFGWNMKNANIMNHYFEKIRSYDTTHHFENEQKEITNWEKEGLLKIYE